MTEKPAMDFVTELAKLLIDHAKFSQQAFGSDDKVGPIGPVKHLGKEVEEILAAPDDTTEYIDALFLVADAIRRHLHQHNIDPYDFIKIGQAKLGVLKARDWPEPLDGEPRLHIKKGLTHEYVQAELGHSSLICKHCSGTPAENAAIGEAVICTARNREAN